MKIAAFNGLHQKEKILSDDHPIYYGYLYLCDSNIISNDIEGTVLDLKQNEKCNEIRNCDIAERSLWEFY